MLLCFPVCVSTVHSQHSSKSISFKMQSYHIILLQILQWLSTLLRVEARVLVIWLTGASQSSLRPTHSDSADPSECQEHPLFPQLSSQIFTRYILYLILDKVPPLPPRASQVALVVKNLPANAADVRDEGSIPRLGRSPGGGHGNPLQYS